MKRSAVGPHSEENDKFERCQTLANKSFRFEEIKKSDEEKWRFISDHPLPLYQGPFSRPIGMKVLDQSFRDFTSFKHSSNLCSDQTGKHILGPVSKHNGSIFYNCQHGNCEYLMMNIYSQLWQGQENRKFLLNHFSKNMQVSLNLANFASRMC